jgi:sulfofructose kinase
MSKKPATIDVLCVGHASYDIIFSIPHHPDADEKIIASEFIACGGGPAANAAITVSKLGFHAAFAGYLGQDLYGEKHWQELIDYHVNTDFIIRGVSPTPLSAVLVKPDGTRSLINFKGKTKALPAVSIDFNQLNVNVMLFDGHEPFISTPLVKTARRYNIPTVLDAGSLHEGTSALMYLVDYLVCSEKFALQFADDIETALTQFAERSPNVVITLGDKGLIWKRGLEKGSLSAFAINSIDTTGAGDAFHGAFAAAVAAKMSWHDTLRFASAAGALCCTKMGARLGIPGTSAHQALLQENLND